MTNKFFIDLAKWNKKFLKWRKYSIPCDFPLFKTTEVFEETRDIELMLSNQILDVKPESAFMLCYQLGKVHQEKEMVNDVDYQILQKLGEYADQLIKAHKPTDRLRTIHVVQGFNWGRGYTKYKEMFTKMNFANTEHNSIDFSDPRFKNKPGNAYGDWKEPLVIFDIQCDGGLLLYALRSLKDHKEYLVDEKGIIW